MNQNGTGYKDSWSGFRAPDHTELVESYSLSSYSVPSIGSRESGSPPPMNRGDQDYYYCCNYYPEQSKVKPG